MTIRAIVDKWAVADRIKQEFLKWLSTQGFVLDEEPGPGFSQLKLEELRPPFTLSDAKDILSQLVAPGPAFYSFILSLAHHSFRLPQSILASLLAKLQRTHTPSTLSQDSSEMVMPAWRQTSQTALKLSSLPLTEYWLCV